MLITTLGAVNKGPNHANRRVNVKYTDLSSTASTSATLTPFSALRAGTYIRFCGYRIVTNFDGGATSELTLSSGIVGLTTNTTRLLQANSVHQDATTIPTYPANQGAVDTSTVDNTYGQQENDVITSLRNHVNRLLNDRGLTVDQATDITITATATGANLTALTQGEIDLYYEVTDLRSLATT